MFRSRRQHRRGAPYSPRPRVASRVVRVGSALTTQTNQQIRNVSTSNLPPVATFSITSSAFEHGEPSIPFNCKFFGGADEFKVPNSEKPEILEENGQKSLVLKVPVPLQLMCPICPTIFQAKEASKISVNRHLAQSHAIKVDNLIFRCRFCNEVSDSKYPLRMLNLHVKKEHPDFTVEDPPDLSFKCVVCSDSFATHRGLRSHTLAKHEKPKRVSLKKRLEADLVPHKVPDLLDVLEEKEPSGVDITVTGDTSLSPVIEKNMQKDQIFIENPLQSSPETHNNSIFTQAVSSTEKVLPHPSMIEKSEGEILIDDNFITEEFNVHEIDKIDIRTIRGENTWIGDRIIFEYLNRFIVSDNPDLAVIDPCVWQIPSNRALPAYVVTNHNWKVIFVPVFREKNHWGMAIFERALCQITYYDSLRRDVKLVEQRLFQLWQLAGGENKPNIFVPPTETYSIQERKGCCGVYCCLYAERFLTKKPMCFPVFELTKWRSKAHSLFSILKNLHVSLPREYDAINNVRVKFKPPKKCDSHFTDWAKSELEMWRKNGEIWDDFETFCENLVVKVKEANNLQHADKNNLNLELKNDRFNHVPQGIKPRRIKFPGAPKSLNQEQRKFDASKIQKLYGYSKKRAISKILTDNSPECSAKMLEIENFFTKQHEKSVFCEAGLQSLLPMDFSISNEFFKDFEAPFTCNEILKFFNKAPNTAPGDDQVSYRDLKLADPGGKILLEVFNICAKFRKVPSKWKVSKTILIHKKGNTEDISNFRPISLSVTIYKIYTALWANRLVQLHQKLLNKHQPGIFSPEQKGFLPVEGCSEHIFMVEDLIHNARNTKKDLTIAWLDLANAFGSVPHDLITFMLNKFSFPAAFVETVQDIYSGSSTVFKVGSQTSREILISAGVKQGDPLSPLLFNIALEGLILAAKRSFPSFGYKRFERVFSIFAYADDLVLFSNDQRKMQEFLNFLFDTTQIMCLNFKPPKCAALTLDRGRAVKRIYFLNKSSIPVLEKYESYAYLGSEQGIGADATPYDLMIKSAKDITTIENSLLAPWQKLDALKTFICPRFGYFLRHSELNRADFKTLDNALVGSIRKICHLPVNSSRHYISTPVDKGGLGFLQLADEFNIQLVSHVYRLLTSPNPDVAEYMYSLLMETVSKWVKGRPNRQDILDFLNGRVTGKFQSFVSGNGGDTKSLLKRARRAMRELKKFIQIEFCFIGRNLGLKIFLNNKPIILSAESRAATFSTLRRVVLDNYFYDFCQNYKNQSKVLTCTANDFTNNEFVRSGKMVSFSGFKFIHRARLNLLPCNAVPNKFKTVDSAKCRHCGYEQETLPHILCHCKPNMNAEILSRHDNILARVEKTVRYTNPGAKITVNKICNVAKRDVRPDLVMVNEKEKVVAIIDVCCPFESGPEALNIARARKQLHYQPEMIAFQKKGYKVLCDAIVVGALGTWSRANDRVLLYLGTTHAYLKQMKLFIINETIETSKNLFWRHVLSKCNH